jgi:FkbM family methyltransferase
MTTISYAQNYEDIMLLRALGDVEHGFYVDIGAQDPIVDSVTKMFYERGWRGINVEPVQHWFDRLRTDRPDDVTLRLLVTDQPGTAVLHEVAGTGLSTMDEALAANHAQAGREVVRRTLECATLDSVLAKHGQPVIHFLKIDVEGAEELVLRGLSLEQHRPWILVIEACAPNSTVETHGAWEPSVLAAGYRFVYFDGLNRFYLAKEQASRSAAFSAPPNVLDDFIRFSEWRARNDLAEQIQQWHARSSELSNHAERVQQLADARGVEVHALQSRVQEWSKRAAELSDHIQGLQRLADAQQAEVSSLQSRTAEWSARAAELSEQVQRLQQLADGRQAQLIEAKLAAAREIAVRDSKLVDTKAALLEAQTGRDLVEMELQRREALLAQILSSRSWRMTRPLRVLARLCRYGPEELAGALRERMDRRGRVVSAALRFVPGLRVQPETESAMPAATGECLGEAASNAGLLSDQGAAVLAAMDRARGWHVHEQERH